MIKEDFIKIKMKNGMIIYLLIPSKRLKEEIKFFGYGLKDFELYDSWINRQLSCGNRIIKFQMLNIIQLSPTNEKVETTKIFDSIITNLFRNMGYRVIEDVKSYLYLNINMMFEN